MSTGPRFSADEKYISSSRNQAVYVIVNLTTPCSQCREDSALTRACAGRGAAFVVRAVAIFHATY